MSSFNSVIRTLAVLDIEVVNDAICLERASSSDFIRDTAGYSHLRPLHLPRIHYIFQACSVEPNGKARQDKYQMKEINLFAYFISQIMNLSYF